MKICHDLNACEIRRPTIVTLGVFDGLHYGHQHIMQTIIERARTTGFAATVVTFSPHPRALLHPETAPPLLQTFQQKAAGMELLGIEQLIVMNFTRELAAITAEEFTREILCERLQAREIYLGKGFAFGKGREGNIEKLREFSQRYGFLAEEVPEVLVQGRRVSSTLVRRLIKAGRVNLARRMLARPYSVEGTIIEGRRVGRELQFPTANLSTHNAVIPADGVYVTLALIDNQWHRSVTNIGLRPTFAGNNERSIECHVLDFNQDLYGRSLKLRFLHRIREELKFASLSELKAQIMRDSQRSRRYFQHPSVQKLLEFV